MFHANGMPVLLDVPLWLVIVSVTYALVISLGGIVAVLRGRKDYKRRW